MIVSDFWNNIIVCRNFNSEEVLLWKSCMSSAA